MFKEPAPSPEGDDKKTENTHPPVDNFNMYRSNLSQQDKENIHQLVERTLKKSEAQETDADAASMNYQSHKDDLDNLYPQKDNESPHAELYLTVNFNVLMERERMQAADRFEKLAADLKQEIDRINTTDYESAITLLGKQKHEILQSNSLHAQQLSALERQFNYESRPDYHMLYATKKSEVEQIKQIEDRIKKLEQEKDSKGVLTQMMDSYKKEADNLRKFNPQFN